MAGAGHRIDSPGSGPASDTLLAREPARSTGGTGHEESAERQSIRILGLREGTLRFAVDFHDPALRDHLEDLYQVRVRVIDEDGTRHFLITRPLEEAAT